MGGIISIEGIDGAGKSTIASAISNYFELRSFAEPNDTMLRSFIYNDQTSDLARLFFYLADRATQHENEYEPALKNDEWIVIDRYVDSTTAYQTIDLQSKIRRDDLDHYQKAFFSIPSLTILLDIPADVAMSRVDADNPNHRAQYLSSVRTVYLEQAVENEWRFEVIDATNDTKTVLNTAIDIIENKLLKSP